MELLTFPAGVDDPGWTVFGDGFAGSELSPRGADHRHVGLAVGPEESLNISNCTGGKGVEGDLYQGLEAVAPVGCGRLLTLRPSLGSLIIRPMSSPWHLGNDIVDLADPRHSGKAQDRRFLKRVFSEEEQAQIQASPDSATALWLRWAGKEAAFKTVSKSLGSPPTFVHSDFRVHLLETDASISAGENALTPPMTHLGLISYRDWVIPLRIEVVENALHAVSWVPSPTGDTPPFHWSSTRITEGPEDWKTFLEPEFSPQEWACVSHRASALARLAARRSMASILAVEEERLEIRCGGGTPGRRIPRVFMTGKESPLDLTLSHHGGLLAWAFLKNPLE